LTLNKVWRIIAPSIGAIQMSYAADYDALAKLLNISGDPFLLAFKEANRIYLDFYDFAKARKLI